MLKKLLSKVNKTLCELGFAREKARFYRVKSGFYNLLDFQAGAHGGYFFINVCVHPLGLPELLTNQLVIPERPLEFECILRQRIDEIVDGPIKDAWRGGVVSANDDVITLLLSVLPTEVEAWLSQWSSYNSIVETPDSELEPMLTVVPILKHKACLMLKFFSCVGLNLKEKAQQYLMQYLSLSINDMKFRHVDEYLRSLLGALSNEAR